MSTKFTHEQSRAITLHGKDILVSAAAGSGKTAVLVERIIQSISTGDNPLDIDSLLVVTFTSAAAAQMRERISQAISKKLLQNPGDSHMQKQAVLIHNAQITTIDSFCLFIIRNNFNDISLDPGFRVADEAELNLLKQSVLKEVLEEAYQKADEEFLQAVEFFCPGNRDLALEEYILQLYQMSQSYPWSEEWLMQRKADYSITTPEKLEEADFVKYVLQTAGQKTADCASALKECMDITLQPDGPYMYHELLEKEYEMLLKLQENHTLEAYIRLMPAIEFGRLSSKKDDSVLPFKRELVQQKRNQVKAQMKELYQKYFSLPAQGILTRMEAPQRAVSALAQVTANFSALYTQKKREKNVIDFSDMEHLALQVLLEKKDGKYVPRAAAEEYRQHFAEILIDEYQDSNLVQELILSSISREAKDSGNRFMVGDVKQSIYKFRLARPELFMEKAAAYDTASDRSERIDLNKNFRSREEILEGANYLFEKLMRADLGGVEYDAKARLYPGVPGNPSDNSQGIYNTELLFVKRQKEDEKLYSNQETEARNIALRMKELHGSFPVTDRETGEKRPARYSDMVVLLRSPSGWDEEFKNIFAEYGIPVYVISKAGYFKTSEIRNLLALLQVLDNCIQDIPLFGVMKSYFGGFSDEDIATICGTSKKKEDLYGKLINYVQMKTGKPEITEKINKFFAFLKYYRELSSYTPIHELLRKIVMDTGYLEYVSVLPAGQQRRANVEMLLTKAATFEKTSHFGLFRFVRYMEEMDRYDVDFGEANTLVEDADVVRLMSIHKSKGLEFPICFVAGLSKRINKRDASGMLIADMDMGLGVNSMNLSTRQISATFRKNAIADKIIAESLGEELRVLYVGLTRACEKLILSGILPSDKKLTAIANDTGRGNISLSYRLEAGNYMEYILGALASHEVYKELLKKALGEETQDMDLKGDTFPEFTLNYSSTAELGGQMLKQSLENENTRQNLVLTETDNEIMKALTEKFNRVYTHSNLEGLYVKTTVSELKKKDYLLAEARLEEETEEVREADFLTAASGKENDIYIPSFIEEKKISGTDRGSAYHRIMELLNLAEIPEDNLAEWIQKEMEAYCEAGRFSTDYKNSVKIEKLEAFFHTALSGAMIAAARRGTLYREQPFVLGLAASKLNPEFPGEETLLVQGIIDVYYEEDGELVVADYKTDRVQTPGELVDRYHTQLEYYSQALTRLTHKKVKKMIIYSFYLDEEILC